MVVVFCYIVMWRNIIHWLFVQLGWASGIGRVGSIVGPIVIGVLLGMELPHKLNFIAVAIPAVLAAIAVSFIRLNSAEEAVKTQVKVSSSIKASS